MTWIWAILLRPTFIFVLFAVVVAPMTWVLFKVIPHSSFKISLFKIRTGEAASRRDKWIMGLSVIAAYVLLGLVAFVVYR